jgi:hypothetical protein
VTVSIAGIGPFAYLGSDDRNNSTDVPGTGHLRLSTPGGPCASSVIRLTQCGLKPVGYVLVDAIPAGQVHGTDTTPDAGWGWQNGWWPNKGYYDYENTHPIPATTDMTERVRAYPITPPMIHRVPMTNAGTAD